MALKLGWYPPLSPFSLIQEALWPNEWKILVVCVLLNCTSRKQVERVLSNLWQRWPDAKAMACADQLTLSECISSLGFKKRRARTLVALSQGYLEQNWIDARELFGVGEYAGCAWDMFCRGKFANEPPKDGALVKYWRFVTHNQHVPCHMLHDMVDIAQNEQEKE